MTGRSGKKSRPGRLRIVAGKWRSRLLEIVDEPLLRPTSERIRETLFNWLAPDIHGTACLDAFAGTGALGLEALSRGAKSVVFIENSRKAAAVLLKNIESLGEVQAQVCPFDAMTYLGNQATHRFDIVFLDPPFAADLYDELCRLLDERDWLARPAKIYLEQPRDARRPSFPERWAVLREQTAGNVRYFLLGAPKQEQ